eukprot:s5638_g4.t1
MAAVLRAAAGDVGADLGPTDPAGDTAVMLIAFGSTDGAGAGIGSPCSPDVFPTDDATSRVPPGPVLNFGGGAGAVGEDFTGEAADPEVLFGGVAGAATELFPDVPFGAAVGGAFTGDLAAGAPPVGIGFSLGGGVDEWRWNWRWSWRCWWWWSWLGLGGLPTWWWIAWWFRFSRFGALGDCRTRLHLCGLSSAKGRRELIP